MTCLGSIEFGLGLLLYLAGAKLIPAAEATLTSLLETVLAPLWVWLAVAEDPGWRAIAGGLVVLVALAAWRSPICGAASRFDVKSCAEIRALALTESDG